jgi:hypothetical protein
VEIITAILVILAVFLLVERIEIRQALLNGLRQGLQGLGLLVETLAGRLGDFVGNTTPSDLIAYAILLAAFAFIVWRVRWRIMRQPQLRDLECPHCGGELHRIHRRTIDRFVSLYVPVRRYRCKNRDCRWQGLRVGRGHRR